jgi:hydroxyacylglutathione hydrolase
MATVRRVVAPNPGPYTGPGTNTWILGDPPVCIVIDPGPDDKRHLAAIEGALRGAAVGLVLVTHSHPDHLPLAERLAAAHHARVGRYPDLADGDAIRVGPLNLLSLHTPGHAPDHLCFWMPDDRAAFTGDLVLGQGSTMITYPEGDVAAFLESLSRLEALNPRILFPGHWDPVLDPGAKLAEYRRHRLQREEQVMAELVRGPGDAADLTRRIYAAEVSGPELMAAAEMTLRAHLRKLVEEGRVNSVGDRFQAAG